jgi:RNase H-fold protein (predicted Holliday junction resolvase)
MLRALSCVQTLYSTTNALRAASNNIIYNEDNRATLEQMAKVVILLVWLIYYQLLGF